jgi:hypothetical protein
MSKLMNIKLFEGYKDKSKRVTLKPEDIGTKDEVIVSWMEDGLCGALLSKEEGEDLFNRIEKRGYSQGLKIVGAENAAYLYYTGDSENIQAKGIELEDKTPRFGYWVNSESDGINWIHKENPNIDWDDEDFLEVYEEETFVMTLKRGCVTFIVTGGGGMAASNNWDGQLTVPEFFEKILKEPYTSVIKSADTLKEITQITREEFINKLEESKFKYTMEGNNIIVTDFPIGADLNRFDKLTSIPPNVEFRFRGKIKLNSLISIDPTTKFNNGGGVSLNSLKSLPSGIEFNNLGSVSLGALTSIDPTVRFNNKGGMANVHLDSLTTLPTGLEFNNEGDVKLESMNSLPTTGVKFNNGGTVYFNHCSSKSDAFKLTGVSVSRMINLMGHSGF